jgi:acyl-CoA synthetase (AMP-forming)/AMP-acid ligase II/acyl carrier protein
LKTLLDIFSQESHKTGKKGIHLIKGEDNTEYISYRNLYDEALYLLHNLRQQGLGEGSQVIIQAHSDMNFIKLFWACVFGKIIPVPVTFGLNESLVDKIGKVIAVLDNPYIITDMPGYEKKVKESFNADLFPSAIDRRVLDLNEMMEKTEMAVPSQIDEDDIAFLQFSSGSTDNPKGVINSHRSILQNCLDLSEGDYTDDSDVMLGWMPLTHDMGIVAFHILPIFRNYAHYLMSPMLFMAKPHLWAQSLVKYKITVSGAPNFGYAYYLKNCKGFTYPADGFAHIRMMISGAEQINYATIDEFFKELAPFGMAQGIFRPTYGLAEATLYVTGQSKPGPMQVHHLNRTKLNVGDEIEALGETDPQSVAYVNLGEPKSTAIEIRDAANQPLPDNTVGCIHIKGPCVTRGYFNNPTATKALCGSDGWVNTGDLGFMTNGQLVVTGRVKELIIVRGQNYYPNDIDNAVYANAWIKERQVASCGIYNNALRQDDVVVFVTHGGSAQEFIPIIQAVRKVVYAKVGIEVARVVPVDQLPKTTSGKVQRFKLRDAFLEGAYNEAINEIASILLQQKPNQLTIARNDVEKKIAAVISRHLKVETVNVRDNFFDLGATSLMVQAIRAELEEELQVKIDDIALFRYPNIRAFAAYINEQFSQDKAPAQPDRNAAAFAGARERLKRLERKS